MGKINTRQNDFDCQGTLVKKVGKCVGWIYTHLKAKLYMVVNAQITHKHTWEGKESKRILAFSTIKIILKIPITKETCLFPTSINN